MNVEETAEGETRDVEARLLELEGLLVTDPHKLTALEPEITVLVDQSGTVAERIEARRLLAQGFSRTNQFTRALEICEEGRQLPNASDAPVELARVGLATVEPLVNLGRVDDAIGNAKEALRTLEENESFTLAGRALVNIGALYTQTGRYYEALPNLHHI